MVVVAWIVAFVVAVATATVVTARLARDHAGAWPRSDARRLARGVYRDAGAFSELVPGAPPLRVLLGAWACVFVGQLFVPVAAAALVGLAYWCIGLLLVPLTAALYELLQVGIALLGRSPGLAERRERAVASGALGVVALAVAGLVLFVNRPTDEARALLATTAVFAALGTPIALFSRRAPAGGRPVDARSLASK